ncbi:hypothetical protein CHUUTOTORO_01490 [Serratia phage vB_SmaM-ChuuTotoro]|nr:hypothetical protein CHUUTOTORO_01490 [Serratia phage vB_SmaM-ChuuTotoro]
MDVKLKTTKIDDIEVTIGVNGDSLHLEQPEFNHDWEGKIETILFLGIDQIESLYKFLGEALDDFKGKKDEQK